MKYYPSSIQGQMDSLGFRKPSIRLEPVVLRLGQALHVLSNYKKNVFRNFLLYIQKLPEQA